MPSCAALPAITTFAAAAAAAWGKGSLEYGFKLVPRCFSFPTTLYREQESAAAQLFLPPFLLQQTPFFAFPLLRKESNSATIVSSDLALS